jgi:Uma2 family endonuclease
VAVVSPKLAYDDLQQLPEDGKRYEIIDGELHVSPAPRVRHQGAVFQFALFFGRAEQAGYGRGFTAPLDVVLDEHNVVQPDLLFISTSRLAILTEANVQGAPDLIIEVLSPATSKRDLGVKLQLYARFKVPHYWAADTDQRSVRRFELRGETYVELPALHPGDVLSSPLFPGLEVDVESLFP